MAIFFSLMSIQCVCVCILDWYQTVLDALVVAMDTLVKAVATAKRVGEKKIYLITDAGSEYSDDGLGQIAAGLREKNIQLIVV